MARKVPALMQNAQNANSGAGTSIENRVRTGQYLEISPMDLAASPAEHRILGNSLHHLTNFIDIPSSLSGTPMLICVIPNLAYIAFGSRRKI